MSARWRALWPYCFLCLGIAGVSTSVLWIRWGGSRQQLADGLAIQLALWRLLFSLPIIAVWALLRRQPTILTRQQALASVSPGSRSARWKSSARLMLAGVCLGAHFYTWTLSLAYLPTALSVLLVSLHPIVVLTWEWTRGSERFGLRTVLGVMLAILGTALLLESPPGEVLPNFGWGVTLALAGAVCLAGYLASGRALRPTTHASIYSLWVYGVGALFLAVAAVAHRLQLYPDDVGQWKTVGLLVLFPTLFGHTLLNVAIERLPATLVSTSFLGEVMGAALLAEWALDETAPEWFWWGAPLTLLGIGLVCLRRR